MAGLPKQKSERFFPHWMRTFVRARETGLAMAGLVIGAFSGVLVGLIANGAQRAHEILFNLGVRQARHAHPCRHLCQPPERHDHRHAHHRLLFSR